MQCFEWDTRAASLPGNKSSLVCPFFFTVFCRYFNLNVWAAVYGTAVEHSIQINVVWKWLDVCPSRKLSFPNTLTHTHTLTDLKQRAPYLDRMVVKVCDHDLILVVHGHKVRTCEQQERQGEHESWVSYAFMRQERKFHTIFGLEKEKKKKTEKKKHTMVTETHWMCWCGTGVWDMNTADAATHSGDGTEDFQHSPGS